MQRERGMTVSLLVLAVGLAGVWLLSRNHTATAQAPALAAQPVVWDYISNSVDLSSLQPKLTELGNDRWEVVSIVSVDGAVDTLADGKPHVVCQRVELTAKRPRKP